MGTKSEASHDANYIRRKVKKHVSRKGVWRLCDQGPPGREGAPLMVSGAFAVALSWMFIRIRCPIIQDYLNVQVKSNKSLASNLQWPIRVTRRMVDKVDTIQSLLIIDPRPGSRLQFALGV